MDHVQWRNENRSLRLKLQDANARIAALEQELLMKNFDPPKGSSYDPPSQKKLDTTAKAK
jgi:hypothetical protein